MHCPSDSISNQNVFRMSGFHSTSKSLTEVHTQKLDLH